MSVPECDWCGTWIELSNVRRYGYRGASDALFHGRDGARDVEHRFRFQQQLGD